MWIQSMHALYLKKNIYVPRPLPEPPHLSRKQLFFTAKLVDSRHNWCACHIRKQVAKYSVLVFKVLEYVSHSTYMSVIDFLVFLEQAQAVPEESSEASVQKLDPRMLGVGRQAVCEALYGGYATQTLASLFGRALSGRRYHPWIREFGSWTCAWIQPSCFKPPLSISPCSMKRFHPSSSCSGAFGLLLLVNCQSRVESKATNLTSAELFQKLQASCWESHTEVHILCHVKMFRCRSPSPCLQQCRYASEDRPCHRIGVGENIGQLRQRMAFPWTASMWEAHATNNRLDLAPTVSGLISRTRQRHAWGQYF